MLPAAQASADCCSATSFTHSQGYFSVLCLQLLSVPLSVEAATNISQCLLESIGMQEDDGTINIFV